MKQRWGGRLRSRREAFSTSSLVKEVARRLRSSGKEMAKSCPRARREQLGALQGGPEGPSSQMQVSGATSNCGTVGQRRPPCSLTPAQSSASSCPGEGLPIHSLW